MKAVEIKKELKFLVEKEIFDVYLIKNNDFIIQEHSFLEELKITPVFKGGDVWLVKQEDLWKHQNGRQETKIKQEKHFLERLAEKREMELDKELQEYVTKNSKEIKEEIPIIDMEGLEKAKDKSIFSKNERYGSKTTRVKLI